MKNLIALITTFFVFTASFAQDSLLPKQYRPIKEVLGDLDKDGINEKVVVYNMAGKEDEISGVDREIVVFKKENAQWKIWQRSTNAISNSKDGGMMGDPFEEVEIKNGLLLIRQSGGSSWKWGRTDKYRYQNNRFELIGYTSTYGRSCDYWENVDFNVTTGAIAVSKEYEKCDAEDRQVVYKKETEKFSYKLKEKLTLNNRNQTEVKIVTPKYKYELYL